MALQIPAHGTNPPPFISSLAKVYVFLWTGGKVKSLSVCLTPVGRISVISNSLLVQVARLFLSAVTRNNP